MNLSPSLVTGIITQTLIIGLCLKAGRNYGQTDKTDRRTDKRTDGKTDDPITTQQNVQRTFVVRNTRVKRKL